MMARVDVSRQRRVENASRSAVGSTAAAIPRKKAPTKPSPPPLSVSATKRNSALVIDRRPAAPSHLFLTIRFVRPQPRAHQELAAFGGRQSHRVGRHLCVGPRQPLQPPHPLGKDYEVQANDDEEPSSGSQQL